MGASRGTRARCIAFLVAATLAVAGLAAPQPAVAADAPALVSDIPDSLPPDLASTLKTYLSTKHGKYSVTVTEVDGRQRSTSVSGTRRVEPASTMKLFYAWAALRAVDAGTLTLGTRLSSGVSVARCLTVMIQVSDNLCAIDLRLKLGMRNLNRLFTSEGYANTFIELDSKGRYVTKRTSSNDLALLLVRLEQGTLLSEAQTDLFKRLLLAQIWRQRISSGVASGTVVASKSGQLWVPSGMVEADTAIIHGPHSTYVLTAVGTNGASGSTIRGISTIVYRYLQGTFSKKASFPARQFVTTAKVKLQRSPGGSFVRYLPKGTGVQVLYSSRAWMRVSTGTGSGWVPIQALALHSSYRWPAPVAPGDTSATGELCTVVGTNGDDVLAGTSGADVICGLDGNDTIEGGTGNDTIDGGAGVDTCILTADDPLIDGSVGCEQNALRLGVPLAELAEPLRPYSDTNPELCLVDNCGVSVGTYCIVNTVSGAVDDCVAWDGWGDGWWDARGTEAGPYHPQADWAIVDRSNLPEWATFVENPGSFVLSPG